jgi:hypothetical protein
MISTAVSGDQWPDDVRRLSDIEGRFVCGKRRADVRPDFHCGPRRCRNGPLS